MGFKFDGIAGSYVFHCEIPHFEGNVLNLDKATLSHGLYIECDFGTALFFWQ